LFATGIETEGVDDMTIHLHWTTEKTDGKCPECGGNTALVVSVDCWDVDEESPSAVSSADGVETGLEITGHWCPECREMRSIAINGS
jgi:predicted RNA-binding Zn-ribbon protein involved in translation (DUF1610 family)